MRRVTAKDRFRYFFDNTMSRGPVAMIAWLGLVSFVMVLGASLIVVLFQIPYTDNEAPGFPESFWLSAMHSIDAGTLAGDAGWKLRAIMALVTIGGIFLVSTLIGVLSTGLESKLDELRKGRSFVLERDHTLILGWSGKIFTIISELCIAQESEERPRIVILADKDKVEMEDEVRANVPDLRKTRVICRSGNPHSLADLEIVNPYEARSVIILAPDEGNSDSQTIKSILALTNNPDRPKKQYHIVAEIRDERNLEVAQMIGKEEVELLLSDELVARVMVQTCRQSGLSVVYTELLDFDGAEIYMAPERSLVGKTFAEALFAYPHCSVIGIRNTDGKVLLNPPGSTGIQQGDEIIAIAEDDSAMKVHPRSPKGNPPQPTLEVPPAGPERTLLLGWNIRAEILMRELDLYVQPGSTLTVVSSYDVSEKVDEVASSLKHTTVQFRHADTTSRPVLEGLEVPSYDHILLLCYKEEMDPEEADAQTLITLLHLRNISERTNTDLSIVSEMLDARNRQLAEVTKADDFIVSDKLNSLVLSQVSQNKHLMRVFEQLFQADGSEIYLKPAAEYGVAGSAHDFYDVVEAASQRREVAIGYRIVKDQFNPARTYGVVVNPDKTRPITLGAEDKVIVLAES
jgi:ion channel POLLUX/CASTOR